MKVNVGFFANKFIRVLNRPALRDCVIDRTAKIGTGSNCIKVEMGRYSYMGKNNSVANTTIGSFCSIASYCAIGGGAHPLDMVSTSPVFYEKNNVFGENFGEVKIEINKPVIIGNDVWIGEGVFIKDGITIGDGAIVGAHSVVTKDVPAYAVVAGAPARMLKYRFSDEKIQKLLKIKWWNWDKNELKKYGNLFIKIEKLLGEK